MAVNIKNPKEYRPKKAVKAVRESAKPDVAVTVGGLKSGVESLLVDAEKLLKHDGFKDGGDVHHPHAIARRTLESVVNRIKVILGYL